MCLSNVLYISFLSSERRCNLRLVLIHEAKLQIESIKDALSSMDETIQLQDRTGVFGDQFQLLVESYKIYLVIPSLFCAVCFESSSQKVEIQVRINLLRKGFGSSCREIAYHNRLE